MEQEVIVISSDDEPQKVYISSDDTEAEEEDVYFVPRASKKTIMISDEELPLIRRERKNHHHRRHHHHRPIRIKQEPESPLRRIGIKQESKDSPFRPTALSCDQSLRDDEPPRIPPLPDLSAVLPDVLAKPTRQTSSKENANKVDERNPRCIKKKRKSVDFYKSKSNEILGELFSVSDSDSCAISSVENNNARKRHRVEIKTVPSQRQTKQLKKPISHAMTNMVRSLKRSNHVRPHKTNKRSVSIDVPPTKSSPVHLPQRSASVGVQPASVKGGAFELLEALTSEAESSQDSDAYSTSEKDRIRYDTSNLSDGKLKNCKVKLTRLVNLLNYDFKKPKLMDEKAEIVDSVLKSERHYLDSFSMVSDKTNVVKSCDSDSITVDLISASESNDEELEKSHVDSESTDSTLPDISDCETRCRTESFSDQDATVPTQNEFVPVPLKLALASFSTKPKDLQHNSKDHVVCLQEECDDSKKMKKSDSKNKSTDYIDLLEESDDDLMKLQKGDAKHNSIIEVIDDSLDTTIVDAANKELDFTLRSSDFSDISEGEEEELLKLDYSGTQYSDVSEDDSLHARHLFTNVQGGNPLDIGEQISSVMDSEQTLNNPLDIGEQMSSMLDSEQTLNYSLSDFAPQCFHELQQLSEPEYVLVPDEVDGGNATTLSLNYSLKSNKFSDVSDNEDSLQQKSNDNGTHLCSETLADGEVHSDKSETVAVREVHSDKVETVAVREVHNDESETVAVREVHSDQVETVALRKVHSDKYDTVAVREVHNDKSETVALRKVHSDTCDTVAVRAVREVYNDKSETVAVTEVHNDKTDVLMVGGGDKLSGHASDMPILQRISLEFFENNFTDIPALEKVVGESCSSSDDDEPKSFSSPKPKISTSSPKQVSSTPKRLSPFSLAEMSNFSGNESLSDTLPSITPRKRKRRVKCHRSKSHETPTIVTKKPPIMPSTSLSTYHSTHSTLTLQEQMAQLTTYLKDHLVLSEQTTFMVNMPDVCQNMVADQDEDDHINLAHAVFFLDHFSKKYIVPNELFYTIINTTLYSDNYKSKHLHEMLNLLKTVDASRFCIQWEHVARCLDVIGDPDKTEQQVFQATSHLGLLVDFLKKDLFCRDLSDSREIHKSSAYKLLSYDVGNGSKRRDLIGYLKRELHSGTWAGADGAAMEETGGSSDEGETKGVLHELQELLRLSVECSSSSVDCANALAGDLMAVYLSLPLHGRRMLLDSMCAPLLRYKLLELLLETQYADTLPLGGFPESLQDLIEAFFRATPMPSPLTSPLSPTQQDDDDGVETVSEGVMPRDTEELAMLLYYLVHSYLTATQEKSYMALRRRSQCTSSHGEIRACDHDELHQLSDHVNHLDRHLGRLTSELTPATEDYLLYLTCLADLAE